MLFTSSDKEVRKYYERKLKKYKWENLATCTLKKCRSEYKNYITETTSEECIKRSRVARTFHFQTKLLMCMYGHTWENYMRRASAYLFQKQHDKTLQ